MKKQLAILLTSIYLISCNKDPKDRIWYGDNGLVIKSKETNDKHYGKWKYKINDNFGEILIRTSLNWNVGDTIYLTKNK